MKILHGLGEKFHLNEIPVELKHLSFAFFIYFLAWGMIKPYISIYFYRILGTYSMTGIIVGFSFLLRVIVSPPLGDLLDKIGRKKMTIFSLANYVVVGPLYWVANSFYHLVVARIYNAFTAPGAWGGAKSMVRDISKEGKESEGMGYFYFVVNNSKVLGPLMGAVFVIYLNIRNLFLLLPLTGLMAALFVKYKVPETVRGEKVRDGIKDVVTKDGVFLKEFGDYFSERENLKISFYHFTTKFIFGVLGMVLALFVKRIGAKIWQVGVIYSVFYLPFLTRLEFGHLADEKGGDKIIIGGSLISSAFLFVLFFVQSLVITFFLTLFISLGLAMLSSAIQGFITRMGKGREGEMTGLYQSIGSLGLGTGPLIAGFLADLYSLSHAFLFCGFICFSITLVLLISENI